MAVEAGGIGARLRAGREKLGLTVFQTAERLHTDPRIVDAIEADDFATLGAPVYARGHIRHYAELVGESFTELNALYGTQNSVAQPDLTRIAKAPPSDGSSKLVIPAVLALAVFGVAGAIWWVSSLYNKSPRLSETHVMGADAGPAPVESQVSAPKASGTDGMSPGEVSAAPPSDQPTGAPTSEQKPAAPAESEPPPPAPKTSKGSPPLPAPKAPSSLPAPKIPSTLPAPKAPPALQAPKTPPHVAPATATSATAKPAGTPASFGSKGSAAPPAPMRLAALGPASRVTDTGEGVSKAAAPGNATVTLHYSADSWTEVYDASGQRLFYDVGNANTVKKFSGAYPLRVVLGNGAGVSVEFNGRSEPIAGLLHADGSAQFSINRSGRVVRARPGPDGG